MKVVIQIPCYNEEHSLGRTLSALPKQLPGIDTVERLVIDDGSTDRTIEVALAHGVEHLVTLKRNRGLATAFMAGIEAALSVGADIIVNTDADNQYCAGDIPKLIEPILLGQAEIVVGARPISEISDFSPLKKWLQRTGSWVVRMVSRTSVPDAPSGFRAISREAAEQLNLFGKYTYTLEMLIQAGHQGIPVTSVDVRTNPALRPSRLMKNTPEYLWQSAVTLARIFLTYKPFVFFTGLGAIPFGLSLVCGGYWLASLLPSSPVTGITPLILALICFGLSLGCLVCGLIANLMAVNRRLLEDLKFRMRRLEQTHQALIQLPKNQESPVFPVEH